MDGKTDRQIDRQIDTQKDRQIDRQTEIDRQKGRKIDKRQIQIYRFIDIDIDIYRYINVENNSNIIIDTLKTNHNKISGKRQQVIKNICSHIRIPEQSRTFLKIYHKSKTFQDFPGLHLQ